MKDQFRGRAFLGGSSYGGRQASLLLASHAGLVEGLLLLSYPLHPPGKPAQLRTAHFSDLRTPSLFVSGTKDSFGTIDELEAAIKLIPARTALAQIEGGSHGLAKPGTAANIAGIVKQKFLDFFRLKT
ncbi:MAG TPA: alpha/beta family hydrolase [Candidatus Angelobacter sp.]|nr:alpha/beta family hydrolase [Candidatus Angelobacter sp.]